MKLKYLGILLLSLTSCGGSIGAGTLGGWKTVVFPVAEKHIDTAIHSLYTNYAKYNVPKKWKAESESWNQAGYDFLKPIFIYFNSGPEEMFYITYIDGGYGTQNPEWARIAIRAVYTEQNGWKKNTEYNDNEKNRIDKRFWNEIITKLEDYTKTKATREE